MPEGVAEGFAVGVGVIGTPGCRLAGDDPEPQLRGALDRVDEVLAFLPGISTTMFLLPCVVTSASATPLPLTRWSMMLRGLVQLGRR